MKTLPLPHDLIIEILLRLPVKSLVRFKCVCKSWFSLISDPHFATSHFELAAAPTRRLVDCYTRSCEIRSIDLDDPAYAYATLKFNNTLTSPGDPFDSFNIQGSCRGFLFLPCRGFDFLYHVWNPINGVHKQIPLPPPLPDEDEDTNFSTYMHGFGYDPATDDYLVVLGSCDTASAEILACWEFFSMRANTWKEIEGTHLPYTNASEDPTLGSLFNGALHWFAHRHDIPMDVIVAFDLMERRLSEIPLPDDFDEDPTLCGLWVFGGCFSLWAPGSEYATIDIWVMQEHRVHSSWTKTLVLSARDIPYEDIFPICSTESGDIVGSDGDSRLWKYNDKGQLLENHYYPFPTYDKLMYTESLLSLPEDSEQS